MPLVWGDEVSRFVPESDPTEWFDLKKELSSGDDDAVWEQVVTAQKIAADDLKLTFRAQMLNRERVRRSIVAWSYQHDGEPVEVSDENIDRLDRRTFADLVEEVDRRNPLVPPKRKSVSAADSSPTTAASRRKRPRK